jgi:hypothetical protein
MRTKGMKMDLPKPTFPYIGRLYQAVVSEGLSAGSLNRENTDTVLRKLCKTTWLEENRDIYKIWMLGGDTWGDLIKDVKKYSAVVNQYKRDAKKTEKNIKKSHE